MKRTIIFVSVISFCCALLIRVEAQQKKQQQQRANQSQSAVSFDGKWTGKTEQDKAISFTVLKGRITEFSAEGRFQGYSCSTTSNTTTTINQPIINKSFSFSSPGGPGGISLKVNGTFASSTTAQGVASMELLPVPGPPPGVPGHVPSCSGSLRTTWVAWKGDREPSGEIPMLAKGTVAPKRMRPPLLELISPKEGDVLDNGCENFKEPIIWEFHWSEARGAQRYNLYVIHEFAGNPVIDDSNIKSTSYTSQDKGFIPSQNLTGWRWKVRPMINGVWKEWSDEKTFSVEPENTDCIEWTASLFQAVEKGDIPGIKELLAQEWANVNNMDNKGHTALATAAKSGQTEIIKLLLAAGANNGATELKAAIEGGHAEVVQALLDAGACADCIIGGSSRTALSYAAENGHSEIVKELLRKGANPNRGSFDGTPLIFATENGHTEVVQILLNAGANVNDFKFGGDTALTIAKRKGLSEIVQLLMKYGAR